MPHPSSREHPAARSPTPPTQHTPQTSTHGIVFYGPLRAHPGVESELAPVLPAELHRGYAPILHSRLTMEQVTRLTNPHTIADERTRQPALTFQSLARAPSWRRPWRLPRRQVECLLHRRHQWRPCMHRAASFVKHSPNDPHQHRVEVFNRVDDPRRVGHGKLW